MIVYIISFLVALLACHFYYNRTNRRKQLLHKIPGPPGLPFIGNLLLGLTPTEKWWDVVCDNIKMYGDTFKVLIVNTTMISLCDPDDVEILLSSQQHLQKGFSYNNMHPWLKTGLLTSHGEKWKQRRRILTPAFHFNILKKYLDITNENAEKMVRTLGSQNTGNIHSLSPLCSEYTLNIICESAMGVALDKIQKEEAKSYKNAVYKMASIILYRITRPYITDWLMNFCWRLKSLQTNTLNKLHNFTKAVIAERKEYHSRSNYKYLKNMDESSKDSDELVYGGRKKRLAMLDLLLSAEQDNLIDNDGIREEVDTFMFEGHDTTAMAMTFTLMLLAENKEAQNKARIEVTEIIEKRNGELGISDIQGFTYLERCIKESLRLYPSVAIISRYIAEELPLKTCIVPANSDVFIQNYHVHRHPKYWPEPEKFDPDRFLPERMQGRHPFSYIPFSAGPRNCIGQKFAMMELKSLTARILYHYKLEPVSKISDMKLALDLVIRPAHPVYVKFIKISK